MIRVPLGELTDFTCRLFEAAGLEPDKARATAEGLIEADMIGHATHGLALAPRYLKQLVDGNMAREGTYEVVSDRGACVVWRGRMLPGLWLVREALALGMDRARTYGVCTIVIGESQHNGALAAVLREPAEAGFIAQISCSSPAVATVAPHWQQRAKNTMMDRATGMVKTFLPSSAVSPCRRSPRLSSLASSPRL